jgi:hypothetical protein
MTIWWCDRCHGSGVFEIEGSCHDLFLRIENAHDDHDLAQEVGCLFSTTRVQIKNRPEMVTAPVSRPAHVTHIPHRMAKGALESGLDDDNPEATPEDEEEPRARRRTKRGRHSS